MVVLLEESLRNRFRHMTSHGLLIADIKTILTNLNIPATGKKAFLVEDLLLHLESQIKANDFASFDKSANLINSFITKVGKVSYQVPTSTRLMLQYCEPFSWSETLTTSGASLLEGTPAQSLYHFASELSPAFLDRMEAQQTCVHFKIASLTSIRNAHGMRNNSPLRILLLARPISNLTPENRISFPLSCRISVNSLYFRKEFHDRPLDITNYCAEHVRTELYIIYCNLTGHHQAVSPYGGKFAFQVVAAWEASTEEFMEHLLCNAKKFTEQETLALLDTVDADSTGTTSKEECLPVMASFSFKCPLSLIRMAFPGRTINCRHVQCFDVQVMCQSIFSFFSTPNKPPSLFATIGMMNNPSAFTPNGRKPPTCPVCGAAVSLFTLQIDEFFKNLISSSPFSVDKVRIHWSTQNGWMITPEKADRLFSLDIEFIDLTTTPDLDYSGCIEEQLVPIKQEKISTTFDAPIDPILYTYPSTNTSAIHSHMNAFVDANYLTNPGTQMETTVYRNSLSSSTATQTGSQQVFPPQPPPEVTEVRSDFSDSEYDDNLFDSQYEMDDLYGPIEFLRNFIGIQFASPQQLVAPSQSISSSRSIRIIHNRQEFPDPKRVHLAPPPAAILSGFTIEDPIVID